MAVECIRPVRDPNYYLAEPSMTTPTFEGEGARLLGIEGEAITPHSFTQLFNGYTAEGVRLPKYMHPERRGAFEVTVNLPKCSSIMSQVAGDGRIRDMLQDVAQAVAEFIQKEARVRVRKQAEIARSGELYVDRKPGNLTWAVFTHPTSRAGDPHLHAHIVFFNLSRDRREGTWKAIETRYIDQPRMGEIARNATVKGLRQLGYKVRTDGKDYEIVGVPAEVKATFSSRHSQIKEMEERYRERIGKEMSPKEKSKLSLYRRPDKLAVSLAQRKVEWLAQITGEQFSKLTDLAKAAREAVRKARMRRNLAKHVDIVREMVQTVEVSHERQR